MLITSENQSPHLQSFGFLASCPGLKLLLASTLGLDRRGTWRPLGYRIPSPLSVIAVIDVCVSMGSSINQLIPVVKNFLQILLKKILADATRA